MSLVTCENITMKVMEPVKFEFSNKEHVVPVNGDSIIFECSPGKTLIGPNTTTCMEDGQWYPDTGEVECKNVCKLWGYHTLQHNNDLVYIIVPTCDSPLPPKDGYIDTDESILWMLEQRSQLRISFVCQNVSTSSEPEVHIISLCDSSGKWLPNPKEYCSSTCYMPCMHFACTLYT